jgi:hypothetical protein
VRAPIPRAAVAVVACWALLGAAPLVAGESRPRAAWEVLVERHATAAAAATPEERRLLALLTWEQLLAFVDGVDPAGIELADGRTLAAVLGAGFDLSWWTVDGGGGRSAGGGYHLEGTLGQPDAGQASGGGHALVGGFWALRSHVVFRDGFEGGDASRWSAVTGVAP